jgi:hypothetical protein
MGANIVPLKTSGGPLGVTASASMPFTATLVVLEKNGGNARYVALPDIEGDGQEACTCMTVSRSRAT